MKIYWIVYLIVGINANASLRSKVCVRIEKHQLRIFLQMKMQIQRNPEENRKYAFHRRESMALPAFFSGFIPR